MQRDVDKKEDGIFNPATATCRGAGADSPQCIAGDEETLLDFNINGKFDKNNLPPKGYSVRIRGSGS